MGLFGKTEKEQAQEVELDIRTNNTWFGSGIPKAIIRNLPNGGNGHTFEYFKAYGCKYVYPCIQMQDCVSIIETDETFEIQTKRDGYKIVPKCQVIEIQYF
ncbi:MAG: hypothetical protein BZ138_05935 [Methanosphaera sp. rholeuAM270]|nr:MAG: hypothetical protein BZ138_05935 [Methanosphaera sp. rholeuAM270]